MTTSQSTLEATFALQLRVEGIGGYETEYHFWPGRKFAGDFYWPTAMLIVEIEGFGHHKLKKYLSDITKYNEMTLRGYRLIRVTKAMLDDLSGIALVKRALEGGET